MTKRPNKRKSATKKFFICGLLIVAALVALFFVSFSITKLVLNSNQNPGLGDNGKYEEASATPKPTYEELEKMVIEKDKKIKDLEDELERYRENAVQATISPSAQSSDATQTSAPQQTKAPQETKVPQETKAPAPTQTSAPTQIPAPATQTPATEAPAAAGVPAA